jgi:hypothetical protein
LLQGVGYGDVPLEPGSGQFATTAIFSIVLTILLTFFIKNFTELHAERKSLARMLDMAEKKQMLGCLKQMDMHKGVTKEAFTLAVLAQLGVLDRETDINPWYKVGVFYEQVFTPLIRIVQPLLFYFAFWLTEVQAV